MDLKQAEVKPFFAVTDWMIPGLRSRVLMYPRRLFRLQGVLGRHVCGCRGSLPDGRKEVRLGGAFSTDRAHSCLGYKSQPIDGRQPTNAGKPPVSQIVRAFSVVTVGPFAVPTPGGRLIGISLLSVENILCILIRSRF